MRISFNVFSAAALILLIVVVGIVTVPDSRTRIRVANETRAIKALRSIALAQARLHARGGLDRNFDGRAEYGFLADLIAPNRDGEGGLELAFEGAPGAEFVTIGAYRLAVRLPDADGRGVGPKGPVDAEFAARNFLAVAWPATFGRDGQGWYAVDRDLLVAERAGQEAPGFPEPIRALLLLSPNKAAGRPTPRSAWPRPWYPLEPRIQAKWMVPRLESEGVPIPDALDLRKR